jgi:hypothetical protein
MAFHKTRRQNLLWNISDFIAAISRRWFIYFRHSGTNLRLLNRSLPTQNMSFHYPCGAAVVLKSYVALPEKHKQDFHMKQEKDR